MFDKEGDYAFDVEYDAIINSDKNLNKYIENWRKHKIPGFTKEKEQKFIDTINKPRIFVAKKRNEIEEKSTEVLYEAEIIISKIRDAYNISNKGINAIKRQFRKDGYLPALKELQKNTNFLKIIIEHTSENAGFKQVLLNEELRNKMLAVILNNQF